MSDKTPAPTLESLQAEIARLTGELRIQSDAVKTKDSEIVKLNASTKNLVAEARAATDRANAEMVPLNDRMKLLADALAFYGDRANWKKGGKMDLNAPGFDAFYVADRALQQWNKPAVAQ